MLLSLATTFELDLDNHAEVIAALPDGRPAMIVRIEFEGEHKVSYHTTDHASLSHPSIVRVLLAASDLIDSFVTDEPSVYEVEI